jgi:hypothetical protein
VVIAPRPATPRAVQQSTRVFSYSPLVFRWSIIGRAMRAVAIAPERVHRRPGPRGFGPPRPRGGGGLPWPPNTKAHRGSIVPSKGRSGILGRAIKGGRALGLRGNPAPPCLLRNGSSHRYEGITPIEKCDRPFPHNGIGFGQRRVKFRTSALISP